MALFDQLAAGFSLSGGVVFLVHKTTGSLAAIGLHEYAQLPCEACDLYFAHLDVRQAEARARAVRELSQAQQQARAINWACERILNRKGD